MRTFPGRSAVAALAFALAGCSETAPTPSAPPSSARALVNLYGTGELAVLSLDTGEISTLLTPAAWPQAVAVRADLARAVILSDYAGEAFEYDLTQSPLAATGSSSAAVTKTFVAAYGGTTAAIVSQGEFTLALWNPGTDAVTVTLPSGTWLWDVAADAEGTRFFLADYGWRGSVIVLDGAGNVLDRFTLATDLPDTNTTSASPNAVAVSPDGTRLYVANYRTHDTAPADDLMIFDVSPAGQLTYLESVLLQDTADPTLAARLYDSHGLVVSPEGSEVWIAFDAGDGSPGGRGGIATYDVTTGEVHVIPLGAGAHPCEIAVDWERGKAYAPGFDYFTGQGGDEIWVVDLATRTTSTIALPPNSMPSDFALF